jgi:hypothetical protein
LQLDDYLRLLTANGTNKVTDERAHGYLRAHRFHSTAYGRELIGRNWEQPAASVCCQSRLPPAAACVMSSNARDILLGHWGESIIVSLSGKVAGGQIIFVNDAYWEISMLPKIMTCTFLATTVGSSIAHAAVVAPETAESSRRKTHRQRATRKNGRMVVDQP